MRFVWFLNFWGWSCESHRAGMLLRHPLEGIGGNWDEWFNNEATAAEREEIEAVGRSDSHQEQFWGWLRQVWINDAVRNENQLALVYVGEELARVAPFQGWAVFARREVAAPASGLSAVILAGESEGEAQDVRFVDALVLPVGTPLNGRSVVADGFLADANDLNSARESVLQTLRGRAGWRLLARWAIIGRRPYPTWLSATLTTGWIFVGLLVAWLWFGPEPGTQLRPLSAALFVLWVALVSVALGVTAFEVLRARSAGQRGAEHLAKDQVRLRLPGSFTIKGGSAGLPFSLAILHAVTRAYPKTMRRSWLWRQFAGGMEQAEGGWVATGTTTSAGLIQPVQLGAKVRACLRHGKVSHLLTPAQKESRHATVQRLVAQWAESTAAAHPKSTTETQGRRGRLQVHRCRHVTDAVLEVARLPRATRRGAVALTFGLSAVMISALPDIRNILLPPPAPVVVAPSSPSPYFLWVSLDTRHPDFFQVVLDSPVWANRRADVAYQSSEPASVRAEIRLLRLSESSIRNLEEGVVWIERRPCFLTRRFEPGEIVGRYTVTYLNRIHHE